MTRIKSWRALLIAPSIRHSFPLYPLPLIMFGQPHSTSLSLDTSCSPSGPPGSLSQRGVSISMVCLFPSLLVYIPSYSAGSITFWPSKSTSSPHLIFRSLLCPPGPVPQLGGFVLPLYAFLSALGHPWVLWRSSDMTTSLSSLSSWSGAVGG